MSLVQVHSSGAFTEVVLDRPKVNALDLALLTEIGEVFERLAAADDVRGVLLRAEGSCFSAGLDLRELVSLDRAGTEAFLDAFDRAFGAAYRFPRPLAVAVEGHAVAGGTVLALCGDHVALAKKKKVRVGLTELAVGVPFPTVAFEICAAELPRRALRRLVYEAHVLEADEAFKLGVGDARVEEPRADAGQWLERALARPGRAFELAKAQLRGAVWQRLSAPDRENRAAVVDALTSDEGRAALASALG